MNYDLDFLRGMHGAPAEAADEIERLRAEVERLNEVLDVQAGIAALLREDRDRLRAALREIANYHGQALVPAIHMQTIARRAALEEKTGKPPPVRPGSNRRGKQPEAPEGV